MLFVENHNTDPYCNHALEEWLMDNFTEDCFMLWRNQKAVLLGKNQNAHDEINLPYAEENGIKIVRRITGGGAVFTDSGNIMFTFISHGKNRGFTGAFTEPILAALRSLGIPAEFSGRNDLTIHGKKFSGNAQCVRGDKLLHHGTLMYSADTGELAKVLRVSPLKLSGKGVTSVVSRVTNISGHMPNPMDIEEFRAYLFNFVMNSNAGSRLLRLTPEQWDEVRAIKKHAANEWIFGKDPVFNIKREAKLSGGIVKAYLHVDGGVIKRAAIYGDFFGDSEATEHALTGAAFEYKSFLAALESVPAGERIDIAPAALAAALTDEKPIRKPEWLKVEKGGSRCGSVGRILNEYRLNTVCEQAGCPNRGECFGNSTATFLLLGSNCTRNCAFCKVMNDAPQSVDVNEPERVAQATAKLGLRHAVITSVTRDDLPDGGAAHFAATIRALREHSPDITVEALIPDFQGYESALNTVLDAKPDVLNHNVETVPELYAEIRPEAVFSRSIELLIKAKAHGLTTKSGFMLGLGESAAQVTELLKVLHGAGCDIVTIGQYLQPSARHYPVREYVHPDIFEEYRQFALELGIPRVVSGPLVRSSYRAAAGEKSVDKVQAVCYTAYVAL